MAERIWGEEYRSTLVCVDTFDKGIPKGHFFNPWMKTERPFQSLTQFLFEMESVLDAMEFPRAFTATRSFAPQAPSFEGGHREPPPRGRLATFRIRVLFRQNASWQGSITWLEGQQEQAFRSVLELIMLMSTALSCKAAS